MIFSLVIAPPFSLYEGPQLCSHNESLFPISILSQTLPIPTNHRSGSGQQVQEGQIKVPFSNPQHLDKVD